MKKRIFIILFLQGIFTFSFSQKQSAETFSITAGPSLPVGQFSSNDLLSDKSGLAGMGQSLSLAYSSISNKRLGFSVELRGQRNPVATKRVEDKLDETPFPGAGTIGGPNPLPPGTILYDDWNVRRSTWWSASLSGGIIFISPLSQEKKVTFKGKALLGGVYIISPKFEASSETAERGYLTRQSSETGLGFTYTLGTDFIFNFAHKTFFMAGIEYTGTNRVNFRDVDIYQFGRNGPVGSLSTSYWESRMEVDGRQMVSTVNLMVGVGFHVGK